jgi:hypothetical protein
VVAAPASAEVVTFDDLPTRPTLYYEVGQLQNGVTYAASTGGADPAYIGYLSLRVPGGGSFDPQSIDVRAIDMGAPLDRFDLLVRALNPDKTTGQARVFSIAPTGDGAFAPVDLSSFGTVLSLTLGFGYVPRPDRAPFSGPTTIFDNFSYTNLVFDPALSVPEPATWAMMIGGMGMVGGAMRRRRRKVAVGFA